MVFIENVGSDIFAYVVQMDISKVKNRPDAYTGMEIPFAFKHNQPDINGINGKYGMDFLKIFRLLKE